MERIEPLVVISDFAPMHSTRWFADLPPQ